MTAVCLEVEVAQVPVCLEVESADPIDLEVASPIAIEEAAPPVYEGATVFTPSRYTQTAPTGGFFLQDDITIKPIPSNYGLITWNGVALTVS